MKYLFYDRSGYLLRFSFILVVLCTIACNKKNDDTLDTYSFPDEPIFFDHVPIDLDGVRSFVPMGEPNVYPKDHGGFPLKILRYCLQASLYLQLLQVLSSSPDAAYDTFRMELNMMTTA